MLHALFVALFFPGVAQAAQVAFAGSCDPSSASPSKDVFKAVGGSSTTTKAVLLGLGEVTYSCDDGQWTYESQSGVLYDMSCYAIKTSSGFDSLPSRALPIYTRYQSSSGAVKSKLSQLVGFSPVKVGTFAQKNPKAPFFADLRQGYGSSALVKGPEGTSHSASPDDEALEWTRYVTSSSPLGDTMYVAHTSGGLLTGKCSTTGTQTALVATQVWVQDSTDAVGGSGGSGTVESESAAASVISASSLQPFCSTYIAKTTTLAFTEASVTRTSYTSTITVPRSASTVWSTLTSYTVPTTTVPAALDAYPTDSIKAACSSAVTPATFTKYKTVLQRTATALANKTKVGSGSRATGVVQAFKTVKAPASGSTVYLAGDSSVEDRNNVSSTGWGSYGYGFPLLSAEPVLDFGSGGATTQSYLDGHRNKWKALLSKLRDGATVVLEFGINDSHQNIAKNTTIYSKPMGEMIDIIKSKFKDVTFIISSPIPLPTVNGSFKNGKYYLKYFSGSANYDWSKLARDTAADLGVLYVDHANAVADAYRRLGKDYVTSLYEDGIHTNATGAYIVAEAFVRALKCSNAVDAIQLNSDGQKLEPFCSKYGVSSSSNSGLQLAQSFVAEETPETTTSDDDDDTDVFCFAISQCFYGDECLPICTPRQLTLGI